MHFGIFQHEIVKSITFAIGNGADFQPQFEGSDCHEL